jgi:Family of unknown function (DUF6445)
VAVLHYLCDASHGGTAFYRHRETRYESLDAQRVPGYLQSLERELTTHGPPEGEYVRGDGPLFEQIASFDARFNRVLIYRGRALHAGSIAPTATLSSDPLQGRLTANAFFYGRPREALP